jgi:hypothetical protein
MMLFLYGLIRRLFAPVLCDAIDAPMIAGAARRFATEATRLYIAGLDRVRGAATGQLRESIKAAYFNAMVDAYSVGARETLRRVQGDFRPESWTD